MASYTKDDYLNMLRGKLAGKTDTTGQPDELNDVAVRFRLAISKIKKPKEQ